MKSRKESSPLTLCAVGDVSPSRPEPAKHFDLCKDVLKGFDIRMCQLETNFMGERLDFGVKRDPSQIESIKAAGFDLVTFAGNHATFGGASCMLEGIEHIRKNGIEVVGAGKNLAEARKPVIMKRKGTRLAFLNYGSIMREGGWAEESKPGIAPLRIKTLYEPFEQYPGAPARALTYPEYEDLDHMLEDIKKAKVVADVVVLALHWGIHYMEAELAKYQKPVGHYAIDAGADIVIGTHPHILKGIEVYKGKVILYSLGNFAFDSFPSFKIWPPSKLRRESMEVYHWEMEPAWTGYPYPVNARKTFAVKCLISGKKIEKVSFLPAMIDKEARPRIISRKDKDFNEVVKYVTDISENAGLNGHFTVEGDEVVIS